LDRAKDGSRMMVALGAGANGVIFAQNYREENPE
jgi:hypothetical protein